MIVSLQDPKAISAKTKEPVVSANWHIILNDQFVGTMNKKVLRPCLALKLDDAEMLAVMTHLREELAPREVLDAIQPPEPPKQADDDAEYVDPFATFEQ